LKAVIDKQLLKSW